MTEIDDASTQFVEAEIKEHHAALIRGWNHHLRYVDIGGTASLIRADTPLADSGWTVPYNELLLACDRPLSITMQLLAAVAWIS